MDCYYLACTLPLLRFGELPKLTEEAFVQDWVEHLPEKERTAVREATLLPGKTPASRALREYWIFETALRNAVSRRRLSGSEAKRDQRPESHCLVWVDSAVHEAANAPNPLERERRIDKIRWSYLDELESSNAFCADFFVIYKLKLAILEKYRARQAKPGEHSFRLSVHSILQQAESKS